MVNEALQVAPLNKKPFIYNCCVANVQHLTRQLSQSHIFIFSRNRPGSNCTAASAFKQFSDNLSFFWRVCASWPRERQYWFILGKQAYQPKPAFKMRAWVTSARSSYSNYSDSASRRVSRFIGLRIRNRIYTITQNHTKTLVRKKSWNNKFE